MSGFSRTNRHTDKATPDVVVIGGGPAGSTVSTLIAQQDVASSSSNASNFRAFTSANR